MTGKRGICALSGPPPEAIALPPFDVEANCITIRAAMAGRLAFVADGKAKADVGLPPLSAFNEAVERLRHGEASSRVVIDIAVRVRE